MSLKHNWDDAGGYPVELVGPNSLSFESFNNKHYETRYRNMVDLFLVWRFIVMLEMCRARMIFMVRLHPKYDQSFFSLK